MHSALKIEKNSTICFYFMGGLEITVFTSRKQVDFCIPRVQKEIFCIPRARRARGMQKFSFWTRGMQKSTCLRDEKPLFPNHP